MKTLNTVINEKLLAAAKEIVIDFDTYGETLQSDRSDGTYGSRSSIEKLRSAIIKAERGKE